MRIIAAALILANLFVWATPSFSEGSQQLPAACGALVEALDNPNKDTLVNTVENCIPYEKLIISARNWNNFVISMREFAGNSTYVNTLHSAFYEEHYALNFPQAFVDADDAMVKAVVMFVLMKDTQRMKVYSGLTAKWRNGVLERVVPNGVRFSETLEILNRGAPTGLLPQGHSPKTLLKCLILNDPFTLELEKVIASKRFKSCLLNTW